MSNEGNEIRGSDLPHDFFDRLVREHLGPFSVGLLGVKMGPSPSLELCGSGTLVYADGSHYILTAAHVWTKKLHYFDHLALTLKESNFHEFLIELSLMQPPHLIGPSDDEEWGPDLCFLRIPPIKVGTLEAYKSFYNLSKRRQFALAQTVERDGPWVLMGIPATESVFKGKTAELQTWGAISSVHEMNNRGNFDYLDLGIDLSKGPPDSFGGMSGGGLWQVHLELHQGKDGQHDWDARTALEGVAFYQSPPLHGRRIIRCHGRRSIYLNIPN